MARAYLQDIKREKKVYKGILKADIESNQIISGDQLPTRVPEGREKVVDL